MHKNLITFAFVLTLSSAWFWNDLPAKQECTLDPMYEQRIQQYFQVFKDGITEQMIQQTAQVMPEVCVAEIKNHKLVNDCLNVTQDHPYTRKALQRILPDLPDMKFAINFHDVPRTFRRKCNRTTGAQSYYLQKACYCDPEYNISDHSHSALYMPLGFKPIYEKLVILSPATIPQCHNDIVIPSEHHFKAAIHRDFPKDIIKWEDKKFKAVWRGGLTDIQYPGTADWDPVDVSQRLHLTQKCKNRQECDVKFQSLGGHTPELDEYMEKNYKSNKAKGMTLCQMASNKLIIDIDGATYSERFHKILKLDSVIFKIFTFDDIGTLAVRPWLHYVPIKMDLSDFDEKFEWARTHDHEMKAIAQRGKKRSYQVHSYEAYRCYFKRVLLKMHSLLQKGRRLTTQDS